MLKFQKKNFNFLSLPKTPIFEIQFYILKTPISEKKT